MTSSKFFSRLVLFLLCLGATTPAGAQIRNQTLKKATEKALRESLRPIKIENKPPFSVDSVLAGPLVLPEVPDLSKSGKPLDVSRGRVFLDCLAVEDDALWEEEASILSSRLEKVYPKRTKEEWRELLDSGRSQKDSSLRLFTNAPKFFLDVLVGKEEQDRKVDGLSWTRPEESD